MHCTSSEHDIAVVGKLCQFVVHAVEMFFCRYIMTTAMSGSLVVLFWSFVQLSLKSHWIRACPTAQGVLFNLAQAPTGGSDYNRALAHPNLSRLFQEPRCASSLPWRVVADGCCVVAGPKLLRVPRLPRDWRSFSTLAQLRGPCLRCSNSP